VRVLSSRRQGGLHSGRVAARLRRFLRRLWTPRPDAQRVLIPADPLACLRLSGAPAAKSPKICAQAIVPGQPSSPRHQRNPGAVA
jgi:hypothetical protein